MEDNNTSDDIKDIGYEIFIALVSIISVINAGVLWIPWINENTRSLILIINFGLTLIFLLDFAYRLLTSERRIRYLIWNWGWADLLACAPQMRVFRLFRIFKAYRIINRLGFKKIIAHLSENRADTAIYILISSVFIIIELGSFFILIAENASDQANILNASDAIWWTYVTITTVGYGDHYPVTNMGRLIGILVMTTGVGIFATFAGYIANKLLKPRDEGVKKISGVEIKILDQLEKIHTAVEEDRMRNLELSSRLDKIEAMIKKEN
jgi:voltage-gated potassium channel